MDEIGVGAEFGQDRKYRYCLWRIWDLSKPRVMFIGLNPSTADDKRNDNTITKVMKIAKHNGFGGVYMMNLFPYVTPYPSTLYINDEENVINDEWLGKIYDKCKSVVFCWGNFREARDRSTEVMKIFVHPKCLAKNKNGSPKHPLYCKDETILIPFK